MVILLPIAWFGLAISQAPNASVGGLVVDHDGKSVAEADVWLAGPSWWGAPGILAHGRSGATGRFTLERPAEVVGPPIHRPQVLWAFRPGRRLGHKALPGRLLEPGDLVRVTIGPPARTIVRVVGPDQGPVSGARVRLNQVHLEIPWLPEPLADRIAATTDARGEAVLDGVRPEDVAFIEVAAEGFGIQRATSFPPDANDKTISLRSTGRLSGRLVADQPEAVRGWSITATIKAEELGPKRSRDDQRRPGSIPGARARRRPVDLESQTARRLDLPGEAVVDRDDPGRAGDAYRCATPARCAHRGDCAGARQRCAGRGREVGRNQHRAFGCE
jgi:hypothetical protein